MEAGGGRRTTATVAAAAPAAAPARLGHGLGELGRHHGLAGYQSLGHDGLDTLPQLAHLVRVGVGVRVRVRARNQGKG